MEQRIVGLGGKAWEISTDGSGPIVIRGNITGKDANVDAYNNLFVTLGTALSSLVDSITAVLNIGSPTAGYETSGASPATSTSGGAFDIAADADVTNPAGINWQSVTIGAAATGADIATAMQTVIRALGGIYTLVTVTYGTTYVITSGSQGLGSQVMVRTHLLDGLAAALKIGVANGATDTNGTVGTAVSSTNPLPVCGSAGTKKLLVSWPYSVFPAGTTVYLIQSNVITLNARGRFYEGSSTLDQGLTNVIISPYVSTFGNGNISLSGTKPAQWTTLPAGGNAQTNDAWLVADSIQLTATVSVAPVSGYLYIHCVEVI